MRGCLEKLKHHSTPLDIDLPSALWALQMAHMNKKYPCGKRVIFMDPYYTCHHLASALHHVIDGKCFVIGTVKQNFFDGINWKFVQEGLTILENTPRGSWILVRAHNKNNNYDILLKQYNKKTKKKTSKRQAPFKVPLEIPAPNAGYILLKDKKIVTFYTNDLLFTPSKAILKGEEQEAIRCVRGLSEIHWWTGNELMH